MGWYAIATPHYEIVTCGVPGNHAVTVPPQWPSAPSGFVGAKWELGFRWHNWNQGGAEHVLLESQYWGNTKTVRQCSGSYQGNDGWVDFIEVTGPYSI